MLPPLLLPLNSPSQSVVDVGAKEKSSHVKAAGGRRSAPYKKKEVQKHDIPLSAVADLARVLTTGGVFKVYVPRPGREDWRATFKVELGQQTAIRMYRTGEPEPIEYEDDEEDEGEQLEFCTGLILEYIEDDPYSPSLKVETLFEVPDRYIVTCDMGPKSASGFGNLTLQVYDLVAVAMGVKSLSLADWAMYRPGAPKPPITLDSSLSSTLMLLRGYGYYEARGYFSKEFVISDPTIPFETELAQIETVSLTWTHTIATTPLKSLAVAVATFPDVMNSLGFAVPKYCRDKYTRVWCTEHSELVSNKTVKPIFDFIEVAYDNATASNYMNYSMRKLCDVMAVGTELFQNTFGSALMLPFHAAIETEEVNLRKFIVNGRYLAVQANPGGPNLVPVLRWLDVRSDVRVEIFH